MRLFRKKVEIAETDAPKPDREAGLVKRKAASPRRHPNHLASSRYEGRKSDFTRRLNIARESHGNQLVDLSGVQGYEVAYILRFAELWNCREGTSVQRCLLHAIQDGDMPMLYGLGDKRAAACFSVVCRIREEM